MCVSACCYDIRSRLHYLHVPRRYYFTCSSATSWTSECPSITEPSLRAPCFVSELFTTWRKSSSASSAGSRSSGRPLSPHTCWSTRTRDLTHASSVASASTRSPTWRNTPTSTPVSTNGNYLLATRGVAVQTRLSKQHSVHPPACILGTAKHSTPLACKTTLR